MQIISLEKMNTKSKTEMRWAKKLFITAFPAAERPPFFFLKARSRFADWLKICADGKEVGFFYMVGQNDVLYVFYFAINEEQRGKHIGTEALKKLISDNKDRKIFLAIEPVEESAPNYAERVARKDFYKNCGLVELPKRIKEGQMVYDVLATGDFDGREYEKLMERWLGFPAKHLLRMKIIES